MKTNFNTLNRSRLNSAILEFGMEPYRTDQLIDWMYSKLACSFDEMTNLSVQMRSELKQKAMLSSIQIMKHVVSGDGTEKFLFQLDDGETIESVLIPNVRGHNRYTLCISSQVGCAMKCTFCETGRLGLVRNLRADEIVNQILTVQRYIKHANFSSSPALSGGYRERELVNIVFMGMGEPLHNVSEVSTALEIITDMMGISKRRITLSTSGVVPGLKRFAVSGPQVNLAVSLNATTDSTRNALMPVNKKYPIKVLLDACREFPLPSNRLITFEYVLLAGINDSRDDALRLIKLLSPIRSKVNLIPFNPPNSSSEYKRPDEHRIQEFQATLLKAGITAIVRKSSGGDIAAACGQLRASYMNR